MSGRYLRLTEMRQGQTGNVVRLMGGGGFVNRMQTLGIRPGVRVVKKSTLFGRGPVILQVGGTEIALGYGRATRVIVEVEVGQG